MKRLFPSLPDDPKLGDVFRRFPAMVPALLEVNDVVMRGDSALSIGQRELIAAYVSSLNACRFCYNAHEVFSRAHGIDPDTIAAMLDDLDSSDIDPTLRPLLKYVDKLTRDPSKLTEADAHAVYDAGWSEEALFSAIQVCAVFNFMNRIVEGAGVTPFLESDEDADKPLPRMDSYLAFGRTLGVVTDR